jgi:type VI secretion system protein ImpF
VDSAVSEYHATEALRTSVRRNLEDLLNTRARATSWPAELSELETSLANYGIPDITAAQLQSERSRKEFLRAVERRVRFFEPRLSNVRVVALKAANYYDSTLRFRIDAALFVDDAPMPITFDSTFDPTEGCIKVQGGNR